MSSYADFPPIQKFKLVLRSAPEAALLYTDLHSLIPKAKSYSVKRTDIKSFFLISPTLFRNHLLALSRLDLLTFEETEGFFVINLFPSETDV